MECGHTRPMLFATDAPSTFIIKDDYIRSCAFLRAVCLDSEALQTISDPVILRSPLSTA